MKQTTWQQDAAKVLNRLAELESEPSVRSSELVRRGKDQDTIRSIMFILGVDWVSRGKIKLAVRELRKANRVAITCYLCDKCGHWNDLKRRKPKQPPVR